MNKPALVVLAAGMGSRYGGLKQAVPVNASGETIVDYSVFDALRAGFGKVVFVIRGAIEDAFKTSVGSKLEQHMEVAYAFQELDNLPPGFAVPAGRTKPWGTLHATLIGAEQVDGPFAVINADDFYGAHSFRVLAQHLQRDEGNCAMVGFTLRNTLSDFGAVSRGVCSVSNDGRLLSTVEKTSIVRDGNTARSIEPDGESLALTGDEIVSMNMWGLLPGVVEQLRENFREFLVDCASDPKAEAYLPKAVNRLVASGRARVDVLHTPDTWFGVTYPADHAHVLESIRNLTANGSYPDRLWT